MDSRGDAEKLSEQVVLAEQIQAEEAPILAEYRRKAAEEKDSGKRWRYLLAIANAEKLLKKTEAQ